MNLFPSPKVRWTEPDAFRSARVQLLKYEIAQELPWRRLSFYSICGVLAYAIFIWSLNRFVFHENPMSFGSYFGGFGGFFWVIIYAQPWLTSLLPSSVALYSDCVCRPVEGTACHFMRLSGFFWSKEESYYVLHLVPKTGRNGRTIPYGVPDPMTRDRIEAVLLQSGLSKISTPHKPDFAARRKAIWGSRVFTAAEVEAMREEKSKS